jgi:hypothetical protein
MMTDEGVVRGMLNHAGLPASENEIARIAMMYPMVKAMIESLYVVSTCEEQMALIFDPAPRFVDWM